jgi:DNA mismatch endonuclease, patch repair protein
MSRMPGSSTGPDVALRRRLHAAGLRFRIHPRDLPGRPDIALTRAKMAVFVDGCFWHGCPAHGVLPKHNREWWLQKLRANSERDSRNDALSDGDPGSWSRRCRCW